jgi:hypothetical protein
MLLRYIDLFLLVFLTFFDALQINYFAEKYYQHYVEDEFSFVINDTILRWRQAEYKKEISNLTSNIKRISENIESNDDYLLNTFRGQLQRDLINQKILLTKGDSEERRKLLLSLDDFRNFSLSASTTSGFGAITPVTSSVRELIRDQILISLIITGLLISIIINRVRILLDFVAGRKRMHLTIQDGTQKK